jgi:hypothetical protein
MMSSAAAVLADKAERSANRHFAAFSEYNHAEPAYELAAAHKNGAAVAVTSAARTFGETTWPSSRHHPAFWLYAYPGVDWLTAAPVFDECYIWLDAKNRRAIPVLLRLRQWRL